MRIIPSEEGKLKHPHSRQTAVFKKGFNLFCDVPEILGNYQLIPCRLLYGVDQLFAGSLYPPAVFSGGLAVFDGKKAFYSSEMVDPQSVKHFKVVRYSSFPPAKSVLLHFDVVVKGISPKLTIGREIIGRHPRHIGGIAVFVQHKKLAVKINITAVEIDIKGHITDELYAVFAGVIFKLLPLGKKFVLYKAPCKDILCFGRFDRPFLPEAAGVCLF